MSLAVCLCDERHWRLDLTTLERIAAEAVLDFALDGVVYLELRTTPKDLHTRGVTKESYCEAVLRGMTLGAKLADARLKEKNAKTKNAKTKSAKTKNAKTKNSGAAADAAADADNDDDASPPAIVARLILSVDRRESAEEATRTVCIAARLRNLDRGVVGRGVLHTIVRVMQVSLSTLFFPRSLLTRLDSSPSFGDVRERISVLPATCVCVLPTRGRVSCTRATA